MLFRTNVLIFKKNEAFSIIQHAVKIDRIHYYSLDADTYK